MTTHRYDRLNVVLTAAHSKLRGALKRMTERALIDNAIDRLLAGIWHNTGGL